jgi:hypothetical protein
MNRLLQHCQLLDCAGMVRQGQIRFIHYGSAARVLLACFINIVSTLNMGKVHSYEIPVTYTALHFTRQFCSLQSV